MYFITFNNNFSRYGYVYLLHEKFQAFHALEIYINKLGRHLDREVKIVRLDREGQYCG